MKKIKEEDVNKGEEAEEVKESNPDILESAFEVADSGGEEALEDEDPLISGGELEDDDMIDSGDFRVANDW
ncbi:MAG: hypothetical protein WCC74_01335 [Minisyncoccia bacterium]